MRSVPEAATYASRSIRSCAGWRNSAIRASGFPEREDSWLGRNDLRELSSRHRQRTEVHLLRLDPLSEQDAQRPSWRPPE